MTRAIRVLGILLAGLVGATSIASAQFMTFEEESSETKWGASIYLGGEVDSLDNVQFGLRVSYSLLELDPVGRFAPELGLESRKNFILMKAGARGDTRELLRFSAFGGLGVLRIQDFTNDGNEVGGSDETWYGYFGAKYRIPYLGSFPLLGRVLGALPLENVALFVAEEITGLENPEREGILEHDINEWYGYSIQAGIMIGAASGWHPMVE
jgi:hypothetical protein